MVDLDYDVARWQKRHLLWGQEKVRTEKKGNLWGSTLVGYRLQWLLDRLIIG